MTHVRMAHSSRVRCAGGVCSQGGLKKFVSGAMRVPLSPASKARKLKKAQLDVKRREAASGSGASKPAVAAGSGAATTAKRGRHMTPDEERA